MIQIVAAVLVKNEDAYVERVIRNIVDFCDRILVFDNHSDDQTWPILEKLALEFKHIELFHIQTIIESHLHLESFASTNTWIFGVDGDEIYDPAGLASLRKKILAGQFNKDFVLFGNVLNCVELDTVKKISKGYLSPPCRSMTKLYNFSAIESWTGCPERLHGGKIVFKPGYHDLLRHRYHEEHPWDESDYRCLHTVFLKRSSIQSTLAAKTRLNPADIRDYQISRNWLYRTAKYARSVFQMIFHRDSKYQKYHRGPQVIKDVSAFFPDVK